MKVKKYEKLPQLPLNFFLSHTRGIFYTCVITWRISGEMALTISAFKKSGHRVLKLPLFKKIINSAKNRASCHSCGVFNTLASLFPSLACFMQHFYFSLNRLLKLLVKRTLFSIFKYLYIQSLLYIFIPYGLCAYSHLHVRKCFWSDMIRTFPFTLTIVNVAVNCCSKISGKFQKSKNTDFNSRIRTIRPSPYN